MHWWQLYFRRCCELFYFHRSKYKPQNENPKSTGQSFIWCAWSNYFMWSISNPNFCANCKLFSWDWKYLAISCSSIQNACIEQRKGTATEIKNQFVCYSIVVFYWDRKLFSNIIDIKSIGWLPPQLNALITGRINHRTNYQWMPKLSPATKKKSWSRI